MKKPPAIPWVPFAGVHAGSLKGYHARQFLTDGKKLVDALLDVNRQYDPDGQPVVFDLQIEAEILGCELVWAEKATPLRRHASPGAEHGTTGLLAGKNRWQAAKYAGSGTSRRMAGDIGFR
jgi:uroporphyrinogen-III decarboxylase